MRELSCRAPPCLCPRPPTTAISAGSRGTPPGTSAPAASSLKKARRVSSAGFFLTLWHGRPCRFSAGRDARAATPAGRHHHHGRRRLVGNVRPDRGRTAAGAPVTVIVVSMGLAVVRAGTICSRVAVSLVSAILDEPWRTLVTRVDLLDHLGRHGVALPQATAMQVVCVCRKTHQPCAARQTHRSGQSPHGPSPAGRSRRATGILNFQFFHLSLLSLF